MAVSYTKDEIVWIKEYRSVNKCGLQEAKKVLLINRIRNKLEDHFHIDPAVKSVFEDILELIL